MVRGIYTGCSGMVSQMHRMDAIANNLANADLTGYKRDEAIHKSFPEILIRRGSDNGVYHLPPGSVDTMPIVGKLGTGVEMNELFTVFEQGSLKETGNTFDFALDGKGFFCVLTPDGERYTRNGSFIIGKEGYLLTKQGYPVLGENGPLKLKENNYVIDSQGRIYQNGLLSGDEERLVSMEENSWEDIELVDSLKLVNFEKPRFLQKQGHALWRSTEISGDAVIQEAENRPKVVHRFLEASNINPVIEMVQMIEVNRAYEANQKTIQTHDSLIGKLINEAVRV